MTTRATFFARSRHPFEIFLLIMLIFSVTPLLWGAPAPISIEALLPTPVIKLWAATASLGSLVALLGIIWPRRVIGMVIEQVGLVMVGVAACFYGAAIWIVTGEVGRVPGAIISAFGLSCLVRWYQLQKLVDEQIALNQIAREE